MGPRVLAMREVAVTLLTRLRLWIARAVTRFYWWYAVGNDDRVWAAAFRHFDAQREFYGWDRLPPQKESGR